MLPFVTNSLNSYLNIFCISLLLMILVWFLYILPMHGQICKLPQLKDLLWNMTTFSTKSVRMPKEFVKNGRIRNITYLQRCTTRLGQD